jgi:hypothetical protein
MLHTCAGTAKFQQEDLQQQQATCTQWHCLSNSATVTQSLRASLRHYQSQYQPHSSSHHCLTRDMSRNGQGGPGHVPTHCRQSSPVGLGLSRIQITISSGGLGVRLSCSVAAEPQHHSGSALTRSLRSRRGRHGPLLSSRGRPGPLSLLFGAGHQDGPEANASYYATSNF